MRILIQRVSEASVRIHNVIHGEINRGMVIFVGVETEDRPEDIDWLVQKVNGLRIFNDTDGKMNLSHRAVAGAFLVISQFTLHASTKKGNRPGYSKAAQPDHAVPMYELFVEKLRTVTGAKVATGKFGADMKVSLVNEGPVTIWIDSKNRE